MKREFRHGKTKTGRNVLTFDPTFNPMIDEIAGTVSSALGNANIIFCSFNKFYHFYKKNVKGLILNLQS